MHNITALIANNYYHFGSVTYHPALINFWYSLRASCILISFLVFISGGDSPIVPTKIYSKNSSFFKKGLYNSDFSDENDLLAILNPLIKTESIWKPHSLYIMAEYYLSKNQMQKSKEFFEQIVSLENNNPKIKAKAQKRLRSSFSE